MMEALNGLLTGFGVILTPANLYLCFLGSLIGTLVGVLPGVGPLAALALLLPVTFTLSPIGGMVMLASIFYGAMYGGSTTSILLNIPGEAASVVTCIDGHQMARQGRAGPALGIAAIGSFIAGTLGVVIMTFFAPAIAAAAIRFGPPENFALMVLGLVCTLFMISGSTIKGVLMMALGFLTAAVGLVSMAASVTHSARLTSAAGSNFWRLSLDCSASPRFSATWKQWQRRRCWPTAFAACGRRLPIGARPGGRYCGAAGSGSSLDWCPVAVR